MDTSAGTSKITLLLANEGPRPCTIHGYPIVALFGTSEAGGAGAGQRLPVGTVDLGPPPSTVAVSAGGTATFVISVSEVPVNGVGCATAASLQVTPPGGGGALTLTVDFQVCGSTVGVEAVAAGP